MSSNNDLDSGSNPQGEFHPSRPKDEPLETSGHQVGRQVNEADRAGEFHLETLPAGSAPPDRTFQPNPENETPGQANNPDVLGGDEKESVQTTASDTIGGASSADVHKGYGHPGSGQTSNESGSSKKKDRSGYEGAGAVGGTGLYGDDDKNKAARDLESDHTQSGPRSGHGVSLEGAESVAPVTSEEVAAERD